MFFKLGLLIGAALTIGLITIALVVGRDKPAQEMPGTGQPESSSPVGDQAPSDSIDPINSAKDNPPEMTTGQGPSLMVIWSERQAERLSVSLAVEEPGVTACRFQLRADDSSSPVTAQAQVMETPSQRGCVGHFENIGQLTGSVQLVIEGSDQDSVISCRFSLRGEAYSHNEGHNLLWDSSDPGCIGNFNPQTQ